MKNYLYINNMSEIYNYLVNNKIIEKYIKNSIDFNGIKNIIIQNFPLKTQIKTNEMNQLLQLKNSEFSDISFSYFKNEDNKPLVYYFDFFILSDQNIFLMFKEKNNKLKENYLPIIFGDEKIFIPIKTKNQNILEIGYLDNNNLFIPSLFFDYSNQKNFDSCLNSLIIKGYKQYVEDDLLFSNDDYLSPIFDQNNNIIGSAYKYDLNIKDYREYTINHYLKLMIKIYLNYYQIKSKTKKSDVTKEKYYLINNKYIEKYKKFYDYSTLENELNQNKIILGTIKGLEKNYKNDKNVINDKKIILIIKHLPKNINSYYNQNKKFNLKCKIDEPEVPQYEGYNTGTEEIDCLIYYNDFTLISKSIYNSIYGYEKYSYISSDNENLCECYFINNYILINLSKNNRINKYILEACILNDNNIISPKYMLIFDNEKDFLRYIAFYSNDIGLDTFLEGMSFNSKNFINLFVYNEVKIGVLFNLSNNNVSSNIEINQINQNIQFNKQQLSSQIQVRLRIN